MNKKNDMKILEFPSNIVQLEKQVEAILFAAEEPLDAESIQEKLNTQQYTRFRFGVGGNYAKGRQADFVLGSWTKEEESKLIERIPIATNAILSFGTDGINNTMNKFNGK